jgi:hypothetical protein
MAGQYNLDRGGRVDAAQYRQLLADAMKRYGGDRDRAVRDANIAGGFGSSTAQRFLHAGAPRARPMGGGGGGGGGGGTRPKGGGRQTLSGPATGAPVPMDRTTGLIEPPSLPYQSQLAGVPPDLMGLPGYDQLKGVPPDLQRLPQNAVPPNSAMSLASILGGVPPELQGRQASPGPGQPSAALGFAMQPTRRPGPNPFERMLYGMNTPVG